MLGLQIIETTNKYYKYNDNKIFTSHFHCLRAGLTVSFSPITRYTPFTFDAE